MTKKMWTASICPELEGGVLPVIVLGLLLLYLTLAPTVPKFVNYGAVLLTLLTIFSVSYRWLARQRTGEVIKVARLSRDMRMIYVGFFLYTLSAIFSLINNSDFNTASWRIESYHPFLLIYFLMVFFTTRGIICSTSIRVLVVGCSLGSLIMAVVSYYHVEVLDQYRAGNGTGFDENIFGYIAGLYFIVIFSVFCFLRDWVRRFGFMFVSAIAFYPVFAAGSRGVVIAVLAAICLLIAITISRVKSIWQAFSIGLVGIGLVMGILFSLWQNPFWNSHINKISVQVERYYAGDASHNSISARLSLLHGGLEIWGANPMLGTGIGDGQNDLDQLIDDGEVQVKTASFAIFHNVYIDALATTGLLGLVALLVANFILPFIYFVRTWRAAVSRTQFHVAALGITVLLYNGVFGFLNSWLYLRNLPITLMVLVLLLASSNLSRRES